MDSRNYCCKPAAGFNGFSYCMIIIDNIIIIYKMYTKMIEIYV